MKKLKITSKKKAITCCLVRYEAFLEIFIKLFRPSRKIYFVQIWSTAQMLRLFSLYFPKILNIQGPESRDGKSGEACYSHSTPQGFSSFLKQKTYIKAATDSEELEWWRT